MNKETVISVTRWPVLILGNYRTGSNLVGRYLSKSYGAAWLNEPTRGNRLEKFLDFYNTGDKKFVLKIMPDQLGLLKETDDVYNSDCFKIKIKRKDTLKQIISYYIAMMSDTWVQLSENRDPYYIPMDYKVLENAVEIIRKNNNFLDTTETKFDLELHYEDLNLDTTGLSFYKTILPVNYEFIKEKIEIWYQNNG